MGGAEHSRYDDIYRAKVEMCPLVEILQLGELSFVIHSLCTATLLHSELVSELMTLDRIYSD